MSFKYFPDLMDDIADCSVDEVKKGFNAVERDVSSLSSKLQSQKYLKNKANVANFESFPSSSYSGDVYKATADIYTCDGAERISEIITANFEDVFSLYPYFGGGDLLWQLKSSFKNQYSQYFVESEYGGTYDCALYTAQGDYVTTAYTDEVPAGVEQAKIEKLIFGNTVILRLGADSTITRNYTYFPKDSYIVCTDPTADKIDRFDRLSYPMDVDRKIRSIDKEIETIKSVTATVAEDSRLNDGFVHTIEWGHKVFVDLTNKQGSDESITLSEYNAPVGAELYIGVSVGDTTWDVSVRNGTEPFGGHKIIGEFPTQFKTNKYYEIFGVYNGTRWVVHYKEYDNITE